MKKALMIAPAASVFRKFSSINIECLQELDYKIYLASNYEDKDTQKQKQYQDFVDKCKKDNISVVNIKFYRKAFFKNLKILYRLKKLIKDNDFDLIHCHTETGGLITSLAMPHKCRAKKIYTPHGISFYKGSSGLSWMVFYPIEKWICKKMDCVLAMNNEEYDIIKKWDNNDTRFVHGIGVDTKKIGQVSADNKREELGITEDDFFILCVGELNENKNHKTVIKAISMIDNPKVKCVICGVGNLRDELINLIDSYGLSGRVVLAGYRTDIPELLHAADMLAFPSFHEGLPVSVMEAMSAGLPVVCSEIRGNVDLIKDGEGGFLCNPNDAEGFRTAIERLMDDRELRSKMSEINKENVKNYDIFEVKKEIYNIYK